MKNLIVTKFVQRIKFEEDWDEFEPNNCFQRQSWKNILDKLSVSCERAKYGKILTSIFPQFSAIIKKYLSLEGRLGTRLSRLATGEATRI